jgi:hypothetical protein
MDKALSDISSLGKRANSPQEAAGELLADLKILRDDALTLAGWAIKHILLRNRTAALPYDIKTTYSAPGPLGSKGCLDDPCCIWKFIAEDMARSFKAPFGQCNELARQAVRLGFHDAGTWSKADGAGGADGSIILAGEWQREENRGLEGIAPVMQGWYDKWHLHGAGMADLIQMGANVAAVSCPLGPRVRSFVGRKDSSVPAPKGRLPSVTDDGETLVALFADKTISLGELIALIGAHTASRQRFVDPTRFGAPQDSSPGVWDVSWYSETISDDPPPEIFIFDSDLELAAYPGAQDFWSVFADPSNNQGAWNDVSAPANP